MSEAVSSDRRKVYRSAIDLWIAVILIGPPFFAAFLGCSLWIQGNAEGSWILLATSLATLLLTLLLVFPCRYTIDEDDLLIRCGVIRHQIPLKTIQRVEPSRTLASGPALSMSRVLVVTRLKNYVVSPKDREGFIAELSAASAAKRLDSGNA
jgi:membrane protein YdbS with pleckstrin-like domain